MFITRKVYGAGAASFVGYVVSDKYGHETQITPLEAKELYLWLADRADQIDKDITGETSIESLEEIAARWKVEETQK